MSLDTYETAFTVYYVVAVVSFSAALFCIIYTFQNVYRDWKTSRAQDKFFRDIARKKFKNLKL